MKTGTHVRLSDGRTGFVCGSTIDGLTIHTTEGRIAHAAAKDVTVIPAPYSPPVAEPARTVQRPIRTSHEPPAQIVNPTNLSILVSDKWSDPQ